MVFGTQSRDSGAHRLVSSTCWVVLGDVTGDCLRAWPRVAFQGSDRSVPRAGKQHRCIGTVLCRVREGRVSKLMECPAGGCTEELSGPAVGQSGATGDWTSVHVRHCPRRLSIRQKDRAGGSASEEPREE